MTANQTTYHPVKGGDIEANDIAVNSITINGDPITATSTLLGTGDSVDLNGEAKGIIFDADADTWLDCATEDVIKFYMDSAEDFEMGVNLFTAKSGSTIATNTIAETTAGSGVTIDGALLKDGRSNLGRQVQALTVSGAIAIGSGLVTLAHGTVIIAATLAAPVAGDELFIVDASASGTAAHTVTCEAGVTFDGTNNTATLNAPDEALHIIALSATRWYVVTNNGSVALSSV